MTPTIICAIEKGTAERVARAGGELARDLGARIVLAHVREDPPLFISQADRERSRNRSTRQGARVLRRTERHFDDAMKNMRWLEAAARSIAAARVTRTELPA